MLHDPDRHEALAAPAWDDTVARQAIREIARDIEHQRLAAGHWTVHPLDEHGDTPPTGFKSLYLGSAGALWSLWFLQRQGVVELRIDVAQALRDAQAAYLGDPDTGEVVPSYYLGEAGILFLLWRVTGSVDAADRLHACIESNIDNPTNEALWAAPGTMLPAWHLWQATSEERWRSLFLRNVDRLWETWLHDDEAGCWLWTQDLYGKVVQYLGAGHGFAGNVYPLLKGASLLDANRREALYARSVDTLRTLANREGDAANWPPGTFAPRPGRSALLMQWCHGAPGVVTALAAYPPGLSAEMDTMLLAAGEAIWQAGPLNKGPGLCHGTAGNGEAFLVLHRRTGDSMWLDRARAFAMHAIGQQQRMRSAHGRGRYTLWTGDAGLAVYLWQCIAATAGMPSLDIV